MNEAELAKLLLANPDLSIVDNRYSLDGATKLAEANVQVRLRRNREIEHDMQCAVIAKCDERAKANPLWGYIFAIPNGGKRGKGVGGKLKAEGVRAGVLDLFLPVARSGFHGLFIELKIGGNQPTDAQREKIRQLREQGYRCEVAWDEADEVIAIIEGYLGDEG